MPKQDFTLRAPRDGNTLGNNWNTAGKAPRPICQGERFEQSQGEMADSEEDTDPNH